MRALQVGLGTVIFGVAACGSSEPPSNGGDKSTNGGSGAVAGGAGSSAAGMDSVGGEGGTSGGTGVGGSAAGASGGGQAGAAGGGSGGTGPPLAKEFTAQTSPVTTPLDSLASNGEVVVAAGPGALIYSEDGVSWQEPTPPVNVNKVAFGGGVFVGVGEDGVAFSSPDGRTWTERSTAPAGAGLDLVDVTHVAETFVAVSPTLYSGAFAKTVDGQTWERGTAMAEDLNNWTTINQVASAGGLVFVSRAILMSGSNFSSRDLTNWQLIPEWLGITYDLAHDGSVYCASSNGGDVYRSTDGETWSRHDASDDETNLAITHTGSAFFLVGGFGVVRASRDCVTWEPGADPPIPEYRPGGYQLILNAVRVHKDRLIIVGDGGLIFTSP